MKITKDIPLPHRTALTENETPRDTQQGIATASGGVTIRTRPPISHSYLVFGAAYFFC